MGFLKRERGSDQHVGAEGRDPADDPGPELYEGLRKQVLQLTPDMLGAGFADSPILALLMETGYPQGVATLVGVVDGHVSLYLSNGGGIIGVGTDPAAAELNRHWFELGVRVLEQVPEQLPLIAEPQLPEEGTTQFVAVTPTGLRGSPPVESEQLGKRHALSFLFHAAQDVSAAVMEAVAYLEEQGGGRVSDGVLHVVRSGPISTSEEQRQARLRLAVLDAYRLAAERRAEVMDAVAEATDPDEARRALAQLLGITEDAASNVLDLRVGRFSQSEVAEHRKEAEDLRNRLDDFDR